MAKKLLLTREANTMETEEQKLSWKAFLRYENVSIFIQKYLRDKKFCRFISRHGKLLSPPPQSPALVHFIDYNSYHQILVTERMKEIHLEIDCFIYK